MIKNKKTARIKKTPNYLTIYIPNDKLYLNSILEKAAKKRSQTKNEFLLEILEKIAPLVI